VVDHGLARRGSAQPSQELGLLKDACGRLHERTAWPALWACSAS
jgi:hypothetical protein